MSRLSSPIVYEVNFKQESLLNFKYQLSSQDIKDSELLLEYPTVYIVNDKMKNNQYNVYIGETTDIINRSIQHMTVDPSNREDWRALAESDEARMYVIGHEYFNKSLTLDIENKLMHYLSSVDAIQTVYNRRTNQQNKYYTAEKFEAIFSKVWRALRKKNKDLFPLESVIRDSALFKASPFHKLTTEQHDAKESIKAKIVKALASDERGQMILVAGEAGTGKTVLLSSLFYELNQLDKDYEASYLTDLSTYLLVNHDQQLTVYQQIARKLGLVTKQNKNIVSKPTTFINNRSTDEPVDVVLIDEAHLLWTQGKQSYQGKNQLYDLLERARVVVVVFDINQVLNTNQFWEESELIQLEEIAKAKDNYIYLSRQMRIDADNNTMRWIRTLVDEQQVTNFPTDSKGYELKVFNNPADLHQAIKTKAKNQAKGISRVLATFDWEYADARKPKDTNYWMVKDGDWEIPWNLQLPQTPEEKKENRGLSWAEQSHTIEEAGSTYTVQGFDLNYAGVIIGPSVKYRDGQIIFDKAASRNKNAIQRRTMQDGSKEYLSDTLLKNELNVLLTRGVKGLYIYAVDEELQQVLLTAQKGELHFD